MKLAVPKPDFSALTGKLKGLPALLRSKLPAKLGGKPADAATDTENEPQEPKGPFLQRNMHLLPVVGVGAGLLVALIGVIVYVGLNSDAIEADMADRVPKTEVTQFEFVDRRSDPNAAEAPAAEQHASNGEMTTDPGHSSGEHDTAHNAEPTGTAAPEPQVDSYAGNLAAYPDPGLVETVDAIGQLPRIGDDGRLPWRVYARPSSSLETRPRAALVVLNLGLSERATEAAIALPGAVTLAFSPYAPRLDEWIKRARDAGHEVMLGLPMEPRDFPRSDAGLMSLMTSVEVEQNILNLNRVLSEGSGYIGVVNFLGSRFTSDEIAMLPVMEALSKRGLVYFDTLENATSVAPQTAQKLGSPFATADLIIDPTQSRANVLARMSQTELLAKTKKMVVVAIQPFPMLLDRVGAWTRDLADKGMVLVPLSGVIAARMREG